MGRDGSGPVTAGAAGWTSGAPAGGVAACLFRRRCPRRGGGSLASKASSKAETKKAVIGEGTKANHLTYLGDCTIGRDTNVGAGTITCNYDGFRKYETVIGDRVQVGSDSTLVAPVRLGDDVYVATATTVRDDVPEGALVFNERRERVRTGWTAEKRKKMQKAPR